MTKEVKQAIAYYKKTKCDDFYSRKAHYKVIRENKKTYLIEKELLFGSPENRYEVK